MTVELILGWVLMIRAHQIKDGDTFDKVISFVLTLLAAFVFLYVAIKQW